MNLKICHFTLLKTRLSILLEILIVIKFLNVLMFFFFKEFTVDSPKDTLMNITKDNNTYKSPVSYKNTLHNVNISPGNNMQNISPINELKENYNFEENFEIVKYNEDLEDM